MQNYNVPQLHFLTGYPREDEMPAPITLGGETEGLKRMYEYLKYKQRARQFKKPNTDPSFMPSQTPSDHEGETALTSPYLKFGCLSVRKFYWELQALYKEGPHSDPPESLEGQLLWREFFTAHAYAHPNFDKIVGNPVCRQIPWDDDERLFNAWRDAKTGFDFLSLGGAFLGRVLTFSLSLCV